MVTILNLGVSNVGHAITAKIDTARHHKMRAQDENVLQSPMFALAESTDGVGVL